VKIEFIETREKVDSILPEIERRAGCGIIEILETTVLIPAKR
jgi:PII-like signaling protein